MKSVEVKVYDMKRGMYKKVSNTMGTSTITQVLYGSNFLVGDVINVFISVGEFICHENVEIEY